MCQCDQISTTLIEYNRRRDVKTVDTLQSPFQLQRYNLKSKQIGPDVLICDASCDRAVVVAIEPFLAFMNSVPGSTLPIRQVPAHAIIMSRESSPCPDHVPIKGPGECDTQAQRHCE